MSRAQQPPYTATVTGKLQLTICKRVREHYGLRPGDKVAVWTDGRSIFVKPYPQLIDELASSLQNKDEDGH